MNKVQYINTLKNWAEKNNINLAECHVSHGGSLLMLGLRDDTDDVDLTVSPGIWDRLVNDGHQVKILPATATYPEVRIISVTDDIDVHLNNPNDEMLLDEFDGIMYRNATTTLLDKLKLNRDKDQADIAALKQMLHN